MRASGGSSGYVPPVAMASSPTSGAAAQTLVERSTWEVLAAQVALEMDEDAVEAVGRRVGARYVTRWPLATASATASATAMPPPFAAALDLFKFFCKDVWTDLYGKKVDRLQTNHRGVFMFTDAAFAPLAKVRGPAAPSFVALHRGIVRGALTNLGLAVDAVHTEIIAPASPDEPSGCCFTVTLAVGVAPTHVPVPTLSARPLLSGPGPVSASGAAADSSSNINRR